MTMHLQYGYGPGERVKSMASHPVIGRAILSPTDQGPDKMHEAATELRDLGLEAMLDPQSYIYGPNIGAVARKHEENGLVFPEMSWSQRPTITTEMIEKVGRINDIVGTIVRIAPSPMLSSFADVWTPLSIQLARAASDAWGPDLTLATIAVEETAFSDRHRVDAWLDAATTLEVRGFYLLVQRSNTSYPPAPWAAETLANLMSAIHVLSELNDYEVHWGYSDLEGLLGLAAGATAIATGWSHTLRQFSTAKWIPRTGGRQPAMRYPMRSILSVPLVTEAEALLRTSMRTELFDTDEVAVRMAEGFDGVDLLEYHLRYMNWLADMVAELHGSSRETALNSLTQMIDTALGLISATEVSQRVALPPSYRGRLQNQRTAIDIFRDREGI